jgi:pimeloyl-ACP methyl ester carboxylesterase
MFLPGAAGDTQMWRPVADRLRHRGARRFVGWPGFGGTPPDPGVRGLGDLAERVARDVDGPVGLLAQSMGGVVALQVALAKPAHVRCLVLAVTSGGLDLAPFGALDWRPMLRQPGLPDWFANDRTDLAGRLREVTAPVLLLWGDDDPISPVAVGERLARLLPRAELVVLRGGTHDLVRERADEVAPLVERHLAGTDLASGKA